MFCNTFEISPCTFYLFVNKHLLIRFRVAKMHYLDCMCHSIPCNATQCAILWLYSWTLLLDYSIYNLNNKGRIGSHFSVWERAVVGQQIGTVSPFLPNNCIQKKQRSVQSKTCALMSNARWYSPCRWAVAGDKRPWNRLVAGQRHELVKAHLATQCQAVYWGTILALLHVQCP